MLKASPRYLSLVKTGRSFSGIQATAWAWNINSRENWISRAKTNQERSAVASPAIEFADVTKVYQRRFRGARVPALSKISFEVARGEVCAFLGPNGAGKTTSMNILMGFIYADSGRSRVFGYAPGDVRAKQRVGFLPENFAFYRYLNAEKLLQFHLRLSG